MLRQHIQWMVGDMDQVQLIPAYGIEQRRAFHQIVTRQREQTSLWYFAYGMTRAADAL